MVVEDSLAALQRLAAWWRARFAVRVVGITGSIGKTTTKELVWRVLSQRYNVLKSEGNYNNEIGLPLTLLELEDRHECVVLEMGTYGPGEITLLTEIASPQVGIVTNVGPVHLERMGSMECIVEAKSELPRALPSDGVAILNADDERVRSMAGQTRARVFTYGLTPGLDLWADKVESLGLDGCRFRLHSAETIMSAQTPLLGSHSVYTALAAASVGLNLGLSWDEILSGLKAGGSPPLRLSAVPGLRGATLLDDTYNSSPDSAIAALDFLEEWQGRRIAVLGDMLELGTQQEEGHRRVGRRASEVVTMLVAVGELGRLIGDEAIAHGLPAQCVVYAGSNEAAIEALEAALRPEDMVLIKGSRGMAMEQIVKALAQL
jgi:UDP-N-acetylmuramoyl-tripeptide--D-alanyl-D-alanine ligase